MDIRADLPQTLGRFRVLGRVGSGSEGAVFLARDPDLDRQVAIKVIDKPAYGAGQPRPQSSREGRTLARLRHPNIVGIHERGEYEGMPFLVFEYVRGETVRQMLTREGALPVARACELMGPVIDGLACAHSGGVLHLDLSPGNIMLDEHGVPRITDFGLARFVDDPGDTRDRTVGTLRYMTPEHFTDQQLGPYTDVFSLSLIFYEVVTGKPLLDGRTSLGLIYRLLECPLDLAAVRERPDGEHLAIFLEGGLAKERATRYADATVMREEFRRLLEALRPKEQTKAHATVEFLLRRMQRRREFPALSRSLLQINRMVSSESSASARQVAHLILRDYALTNRLLKLANSAFYGGMRREVTSISQAVSILGFEQVRLAASALTYFSHLQGASSHPTLRDAIIRSFTSGLLARHLARRARLDCAEEAFICGMFQNLGENLSIYCFPEDYEEIRALVEEKGTSREAASEAVLGIGFSGIGVAVARHWQFPELIVQTLAPSPDGDAEPGSDAARLRLYALFANELCEVASRPVNEENKAAMEALVECFEADAGVRVDPLARLLPAACQKLDEHAQSLRIDTGRSRFCRAMKAWAEHLAPPADPASAPPARRAVVADVPAAAEAEADTPSASQGRTWNRIVRNWRQGTSAGGPRGPGR